MWNKKKQTWAFIRGLGLAIIVNMFFIPSYMKVEDTGDNMFYISLNGVSVGCSADADVDSLVRKARMEAAKEKAEPVMLDVNTSVVSEKVLFGRVDSEETLVANMVQVMRESEIETLHRSYMIKVNDFTVNLANSEEVLKLLNAVLDKYDSEDVFDVSLIMDPTRELNVLTTQIIHRKEALEKEAENEDFHRTAGAEAVMEQAFSAVEPDTEKEFSDYELGLLSLEFGDTVEVVEAYLPNSELTPVEEAIERVTKEEEKNKIYEVVAGDTLSQIAEDNGIPLDKLIAMNETIENENSTIRIGDEIIVTAPEPELSVIRQEVAYYEEDYDADIIYIDNDEWYTTDQMTRQEPSAGHRKIIAVTTFRNNSEIDREIEKEEVTYKAVPKIVERGTKIPPTFIKPISGGRTSSGFGGRKAPTKGASTYHKGIDWATPTGTAVMASSGGVVTKAGWGSGYGYVVYIDHGDGRQTRYGHLSKVLVSAGQHVNQGQKIALSGNTGRSTGPHLHFEILIGGSAVNPLKHLS